MSNSYNQSGDQPASCGAVPQLVLGSLLSLFLCILVGADLPRRSVSARNAQGANESNAPADVANRLSLEPFKWIEAEIAPEQTLQFLIHAGAGQYFSVEIEHWGSDLAGSVYGPGGQLTQEFNCRQDGLTRLSVIADVAGDYLLALHPSPNSSRNERFRLRLKELRATKESDRYRIHAEMALASGEQLGRRQKREAYQQALDKYQEALANARTAADHEAEADALKKLGKTCEALNESDRALTFYDQALKIGRKLKDARIQGDILNCISYLHVSRGDNSQAAAGADLALQLSRSAASRAGEAQALFTLGEAYYSFGELQKALDYYKRALTILRALDDYRGQAQVLVNLGYTYTSLSDTEKSRESYEEALSLSRSANDRLWEAKSLRALGSFQTRLGEYQKALDSFFAALRDLDTVDDQLTKATVLAGIGFTYENLGERQKAFNYDKEAIGIFQEINNPWGEAETQIRAGKVSYSMGDGKESLTRYQRALSIFRLLGMTRMQAQTLRDVGLVYESWNELPQALAFYRQSLRFTRPGQDQRYEAYTFNYIGRALEKSGEKEHAFEQYRQALRLNRVADDPAGEALTLFNIAHVQRDLNKLDESLFQIEAGLKIQESLRSKVPGEDVRASYLASTHQYFELHADVLMQLNRRRPDAGFAAAALEASERARARSLLESLRESRADIREGVDLSLLDEERRLGRELNAMAERRAELLASKRNNEAQAVAKEIDRLTSEYEETERQIRSNSPRYAALMQPEPVNLNDIQQRLLDDNSVLLEYMLGDERSYLWAVTKTEISSFELPGRTEMEEAAQRFRKLLTARQPVPGETFEQRQTRVAQADAQFSEEAASFSKLVLGPVADKLATKRLLIVPDGALQYIPFQALVVPGKRANTELLAQSSQTAADEEQIPLIVDHVIVNEPSASALALLLSDTAQRRPASNSIAVFANPVFEPDDPRVKPTSVNNWTAKASKKAEETSQKAQVQEAFRDVGLGDGLRIPPLPASREEAEAIMSVIPWRSGLKALGFDASRAKVSGTDLGQYRIVHFATHGFVDYQHPELSGLVLSLVDQQGRPQDGFLRMHDIYNLKLPVDLVVLSACNTGLGRDVKGEGLIGLTRGFMYAGARGVAASLWKVDDEATAELMKRFYEGMFKRGLTPAAALREAQITMWQQKRWHAPYYWAAFVLQGQYDQRVMLNNRLGAWQIAALAALLTTLPAIVFLFLRRRRSKILKARM